MSTLHIKPELVLYLRWFTESPDAVDPNCICSFCLQVIPEDQVPLRIFSGSGNAEIRLHQECANQVIVEMSVDGVEQKHTAYTQGQASYYAGVRRGSNPYTVHGPQAARLAWFAGWDAAWKSKSQDQDPDGLPTV